MTNQWPQHANPVRDERPWRKKKRFVIPLGLTALLVVVGALTEDPALSGAEVAIEGAPATTTPAPSVSSTPVSTASAAAARLAAIAEAKAEAKKEARAKAKAKAKAKTAQRKAKARAAAKAKRERAAERREQERREAEEARNDCNSNYSGCVPDVSDVDCAGGGGDGPGYLSGTARVIGDDVYDLDRDRDGIACDV